MGKKGTPGYKAVPDPGRYNPMYRPGWDVDPGFIGTGDEY